MKKITRKGLIKKLDKLFSLKVRARGWCQLQGKDRIRCSTVLQCAHIIGRGRHIIRWNERNALCLCSGHHVYYTNHPLEWHEMMLRFYPEQYEDMSNMREETWDKDLDRVLEQLSGKEV